MMCGWHPPTIEDPFSRLPPCLMSRTHAVRISRRCSYSSAWPAYRGRAEAMIEGAGRARLAALRGFLVDMDGVIYRGTQALPGAADALRALERRGRVLMLTNNSTKERGPLARTLDVMGFDLPPERILIVNQVAIDYLLTHHRHDRILALGEDHLLRDLAERGLCVLRRERWREATVVLMACRLTVDHDWLGAALNALLNGAAFIATSLDMTVNGDDGLRLEVGAYSEMLARICGRAPLVVGKPEAVCYRYALRLLEVPAELVAMIGDNPDTDLAGARRNGLFGVQVLSGVSHSPSELADLTVSDLAAFARLLEDG
jgi:HAD superfamily hydrolase (TIGR01450 family)